MRAVGAILFVPGVERGFSLSSTMLSPAARTALPVVRVVLGNTLPIKLLQSQSCLASYLATRQAERRTGV